MQQGSAAWKSYYDPMPKVAVDPDGFETAAGTTVIAESDNRRVFDVIVVGAGAAGIGVSVTLRHAGIEDFLVIDRHTVGASFSRWPAETRFITPSFPSNSIGMLDLNSVAIGLSPAHSLQGLSIRRVPSSPRT